MRSILIVDDQADVRRVFSITLGKEFTVLEAEDGSGADAYFIKPLSPPCAWCRIAPATVRQYPHEARELRHSAEVAENEPPAG